MTASQLCVCFRCSQNTLCELLIPPLPPYNVVWFSYVKWIRVGKFCLRCSVLCTRHRALATKKNAFCYWDALLHFHIEHLLRRIFFVKLATIHCEASMQVARFSFWAPIRLWATLSTPASLLTIRLMHEIRSETIVRSLEWTGQDEWPDTSLPYRL